MANKSPLIFAGSGKVRNVQDGNIVNFDSGAEISNLGLAASVGSSALTIALKDKSGSDPSALSPVKIGFRNATAATGTYSQSVVTGALSLVISSGSTLGHTSAIAQYIYVYLLNNAGTIELAASSKLFDDNTIVSTTTEGGAGGADSRTTIYSGTGRSNVPIRLIGRLTSNQATAGTWASTMTEIAVGHVPGPAYKLIGTNTGNAPASDEVGYTVSSVIGSDTNYPTANQYGDLTSISVPAGIWDISVVFAHKLNGATVTQALFGIGTASGNNGANLADGNTQIELIPNVNNGASIPTYRVTLSSTTTYYLKYLANYSVATPRALGRISAVRVA